MVWFDQAAAAQNQGIQGAMQQQAIQAGQAQNAINEGISKSTGALSDYYGKGAAALQQSQTGALGGLENYYNQGVGFQQPSIAAGNLATNRMLDILGLSGNTGAAGYNSYNQPFTMADFYANKDPSYEFIQQQGNQALLNATRAGIGGANAGSGAAGKAFLNYNQGLASKEYTNAYNRAMQAAESSRSALLPLMAQGLTAAGTASGLAGTTGANTANVYTGTAANTANLAGTTGANIANTYMTGANQLANNYNSLGQNIGQGLVNQGAANASAYTNSANLLSTLAGQGMQAAAMMAGGGGGAGLGNAARGLFGSAIPSSYNMAMYSPHR